MKELFKKYYSPDAVTKSTLAQNAVIDSHVHFWKYNKQKDAWITKDMSILKQDYLPEHLSLSLKRNDVSGVVAVQATEAELETHFLVELAATHPIIKGVVGWADLQKNNIEDRLYYFSQYPVIKGFRHIVQKETDVFLNQENFLFGITALQQFNYTYDILIYPNQLKSAIEFVSEFPYQKFVIDHCAKPGISRHEIEDWAKLINEISLRPNVYCKLSGLFTEAVWKQWSANDFYPYLDIVFKSFGAERLLFGSDWPVILLSGIYVQWKSLLEKYMENFLAEEKEKVFGGNAIRFYNL